MESQPDVRAISPEAFAALGVPGSAYVRPVVHEGQQAYSICAADGSLLAIAATRDLAFGVVRQHEMEPVDAH